MIHKIRILGFKSLYDVTVELEPVTVLVGRSGTGKSAFVQSLRFLRNFLLNEKAAPEIEGGWKHLISVDENPSELAFEVEFGVGDSLKYRYDLRFAQYRRGEVTADSERLAIDDDEIFHRARVEGRGWQWVTTPNVVNPPPPGKGLALARLPNLESAVQAYTALSSGIGYYSFPTSIWGPLKGGASNPQQAINNVLAGLRDDGSNYLKVMRDIAQNLHQPQVRRAIAASLAKINETVVSVELDSITEPKTATVGHRANDKVLALDLSQESDGFRRFYAHLLAIYQLPPKLVNVFEEPENGIYPGALALLADEFETAPDANRGQIILTTHSPNLLDQFNVECLRVVELWNGRTIIGKVAPEQRNGVHDNLISTGELLTVDPARAASSADSQGAR